MTGARIVRSILMSAALVLAVVGCPPEPPDDNDAGIGGSAPTGGTTLMGGRATGGTATAGAGAANGGKATGGMSTGGAGVSVCQTVTTLPEQNSSCSNLGESQCLPNGDRCVCWRNAWHCNTRCADLPQPTPDGDCSDFEGTACVYGNGVGCACVNRRWYCTGDGSSCPATPVSGDDCTQMGIFCDYPGTVHQVYWCEPSGVPNMPPTWIFFLSASCPDTQPAYPSPCTSTRFCRYGNVLCTCGSGGNWICDWPLMGLLFLS